jgi:hypothetical protein
MLPATAGRHGTDKSQRSAPKSSIARTGWRDARPAPTLPVTCDAGCGTHQRVGRMAAVEAQAIAGISRGLTSARRSTRGDKEFGFERLSAFVPYPLLLCRQVFIGSCCGPLGPAGNP